MSAARVISAGDRATLARLRRNETIYDAIRRIKLVAPEIDGNARRGQYLRYIHGGSDSPGWGRHYASGSYIDAQRKRRSPDLQGCPRELRRLLAGLHCHDLDFVNSLPTVASQLDALGLCAARHLTQLRHYVHNRTDWFDAIIGYHGIQARPEDDETPQDLAKNLIVRILHGGDYGTWLAEHGLDRTGAASGRGLQQVHSLQTQMRAAHAETVQAMRALYPEWTERLLDAKRKKKAGGADVGGMNVWQRQTLEVQTLSAAFAVILQGYEDRCLQTAVQVLHDGQWIVHSLQQDGVLAEPTPSSQPLATLLPRAQEYILEQHGLQMRMIEKPFRVTSRDDPAIRAIMSDLARPLPPTEQPARPPLPLVSGRPIRPTAEEVFRTLRADADAAGRRAAALALSSSNAAALADAARRRVIYDQNQVEAAIQMRCEAEARAARDDVSGDESGDGDDAAASASDAASPGERVTTARRRGAGMPMDADPVAIGWRPGARPRGATMRDATTDGEPSQVHAVSDDDGDGGDALPADGSPAALELAAMRASDELQRMTIGTDSDDGGNRRSRWRNGWPAAKRAGRRHRRNHRR